MRRWRKKNPAKAAKYVADYRKKNPEKVSAWKAIGRRRHRVELTAKEGERLKALNRSTGLSATMRRQPWSEVEDCEATRSDLTIRQIADRIGRTYYAIVVRRFVLRQQDSGLVCAANAHQTEDVIHAIAAAVSPNEDKSLPTDIEWMPAGEHEITASRAGKPHTLTMKVQPEHAALVNTKLQAMIAAADAGTGDRPFFDKNHNDEEASAHPTEFYWDNGIRAKVKWTGAGEAAVRGRDYSRFSPSFYPDKAGNVVDIPVNCGGLVNRAAFQKIQSVVRSKSAGAEEDPATTNKEKGQRKTMEALLKVLAKLGLIASADVDEVTAATQVTENHSKLVTAKTKAEGDLTDVQAKLKTSGETLTALTKAHATSVVDAAIQAGRIPGQDDKIKAKWVGLIEANAENAELLPEPNPALQKVISGAGKKDAETKAGGGGEHEFLVTAKAYQAEHKVSEAFSFQKVAAKNPALYESYRTSLGLGENHK